MNSSLEHRGPDGDGFHFEPGVGFGHRRLSIIDLEGGKQPLYNEDHTVVVTYNGEIYNFKEIEVELRARGHTFRTRCDTEVIVHAWEEWGERCLDRFNGMFAFAIWDQTARRCSSRATASASSRCITRCWRTAACCLRPSSRRCCVSAMFRVGSIRPQSRITSRSATFRIRRRSSSMCTSSSRSSRLPSKRGSTACRTRRYWDVPLFGRGECSIDQTTPPMAVATALKEAVQRRLVADVPLGAFLSGGIDSSAVVAMMREIGVDHLLTCSIGFNEPQYDESRYAKLVADQKHTDHKAEIVEASDYGLLDQLASIYDEPFADSSAIPTYRVCQLARKHVTVALSGDGGDENFIGYRRYKLFQMEERIRAPLPLAIRRPSIRRARTLVSETRLGTARISREDHVSVVGALRIGRLSPRCDDRVGRECGDALYSHSFKSELQGYGAEQVFARHLKGREFADALRMVQYLDFKTYLPGDILTKVDRASMAHSLEVRVPFLDYQFVEKVAALPSNFKLRSGEAKYGLKKALEPYLPRDVLYRKKMGFAVPLDVWFRGSLAQRLSDVVNGRSAARLRNVRTRAPCGCSSTSIERTSVITAPSSGRY